MYNKLFVALLAALAQGVSVGTLHGTAGHVVTVVLSVLAAAGVYVIPNAPTV